MNKILKYSFYDLIRSRWVYGYFLFNLIISFGLVYFSNDSSKAIISLMNIILILNPLIGILFGSLYLYKSAEFIDLLLAQPLRRTTIFLGMYLGLNLSLVVSFLLGAGIPFLLNSVFHSDQVLNLLLLLISGSFLIFIFSGIAFLISIRISNTVKGFGIAIFIWLFLSLIYDGLFLLSLMSFSEYPLDKYALIVSLFNPIDLSRVLILLKLDISALMGYTGAVFNKFLGTSAGMSLSLLFLIVWILIPVIIFTRLVRKKDF